MEPLTGGPLALDLLNTCPVTVHGPRDAFDSPATAAGWLAAQHRRLTPPPVPPRPAELAALKALREQVRAAVRAVRWGQAPPAPALAALHAAARAAPAYPVVEVAGTRLVAARRRDGTAVAVVQAELAEAAIELLTGAELSRVRDCEAPGCRMLFLPAHPRRRWCSAMCGNRVRVARHYRRHHADPASPS